MVKQLSKLVELKSIMSIALVGATVYGFIADKIASDVFMGLVMAVVTYYFTRKNE